MGQRFALVAVERTMSPPRPAVCAVAGAGPRVPSRFPSDVLSACAAAAASGTFFRKALDSCERPMLMPSRASISARRRGIVQLRRSATGSLSKGVTTRRRLHSSPQRPRRDARFQCRDAAAGKIAAPEPNRILAHAKRLRNPGLVQPASVSSTARARSASPRSRQPARAERAARCSPLATTRDFPAMPHTMQINGGSEAQKTYPLVNQTEFC